MSERLKAKAQDEKKIVQGGKKTTATSKKTKK
jgi:hypothetical protein